MSTLKTTYLQHPSASSANVTLASDGKATFNGAVVGAGMDLISKTDFSNVASASINNVFTSAYQSYRITVVTSAASGTTNLYMRYRSSGSDITGADYNRCGWSNSFGGLVANSNSADVRHDLGAISTATGDQGFISIEVHNPAMASATRGYNLIWGNNVALGNSMMHTLATAYDGFSIYTGSGTYSATIRVYGYRNS